jgi:hypothetical protein
MSNYVFGPNSGQSFDAPELPTFSNYLQQAGLSVRKSGDAHYVPCPWVGRHASPTHSTVQIDHEAGGFHCPLCASYAGDIVSYDQLSNRRTYAQAIDALRMLEDQS